MRELPVAAERLIAPVPKPAAFERALLLLSAATTVALLAWLLFYAGYGIDFTDEGLYLNWVATPFAYHWSISQFGFVYHPLHTLLGGDIANLRRANILIVFSLAWVLFAVLLREPPSTATRNRLAQWGISAGLAVASLTVFSSWLLTPNYNTLTLQALLIVSIGIVLTQQSRASANLVGAVLIGTGGWLSFMAKPSSALAVAVLVLMYLVSARKLSRALLGTAVATAVACLYASAVLIDGSAAGFVRRIQTSLDMAKHLDAGHSVGKIFRLDSYALLPNETLAIAVLGSLVLIAMAGNLSKRDRHKSWSALISAALLGTSLVIASGIVHGSPGFGTYQGLVLFAFPLAAFGLMLVELFFRPPVFQFSHLWLVLFFLLMPYAYAFGTNGNYWWAQGFASVFWLVAATAFLMPWARQQQGWVFMLPMAVAAQAVAALLLLSGLNQPYRQPQALRLNDSSVQVPKGSGTLKLPAATAQYIQSAQDAALRNGFQPGTPMIDLSGQSPGLLYALQARSVGQAWMIGGYPGSQKLAQAALAQIGCEELANAWLLMEVSGPRSLPASVVESYGASADVHFEAVASWRTSAGAGGYAKDREQTLLKPIASTQVDAQCRALGDRSEAH